MYCPKSEQLVRLWRAKFHNLRLCDDFFWWGKGGVACQFCWMKGKICTLRKEYLPLLSQIFGKVRCCFQVKSEEMERNLDQHWEDWSAIFHCFHIGKGTMKKFWNLFFGPIDIWNESFSRMFGRLTSKNWNGTEENCTSIRSFFRFICHMNVEFDTEIDRIMGECYSKT